MALVHPTPHLRAGDDPRPAVPTSARSRRPQMMKARDGTKPALSSGQLVRDFLMRQVGVERVTIVRRKHTIHRWAGMGEDVAAEQRLLDLAQKRLRRLLIQRQKAFAVLRWDLP
jgi:hypothetical protein